MKKRLPDSPTPPVDASLFTRRQIIAGAAVGAASLLLPVRSIAKPLHRDGSRRQLNVLLIVVGGERSWDRLPGNLDVPARERLQQRSVEFSRFYAASPTPAPALAAALTGLHGPNNGVTDSIGTRLIGTELSTDKRTLAHTMRDGGWHTTYFGDWNLSALSGSPQRSDLLDQYGFSWSSPAPAGLSPELSDRRTARETSVWLKTRASTLRQPWLATVYLNGPSGAMRRSDSIASAQTLERYGQLRADPGPSIDAHSTASGVNTWRPLKHSTVGGCTSAYHAAVQASDQRLSEILDALDTGGGASDTIVVYTSDCGVLLGAHGQFGTGPFMYDDITNVPLLINHPEGPGAVRSNALLSSVDLLPTVLDLANVPSDSQPPTAGRSIARNLFAPSAKSPRDRAGHGALITHSALSGLSVSMKAALDPDFGSSTAAAMAILTAPQSGTRGFYRAIVDDRYKMARYFAPGEHHQPANLNQLRRLNDLELYDLKHDPSEDKNLAINLMAGRRGQISHLNGVLNALTQRELESDDGSYLPGPGFLWRA